MKIIQWDFGIFFNLSIDDVSKIMLMLLLVSQILDNVQSTIKKAKLFIVFGWRGENKDMSTFYLLWIYVRYKHLLIIKGRAHKTLSVTSVPRGVEILGSIVLDIYWTFPINLCFRCMKIKSICFFFDMKMVLVKILMEAAFTCKIVLITVKQKTSSIFFRKIMINITIKVGKAH